MVLINSGSASAAEIVAGALQDRKRADRRHQLRQGLGADRDPAARRVDGALKLTTARYYTPSGRSIQKTGIEPDIKVEQAKIEKIQARAGFREENLRRSIINPNAKPGEKPADKPADAKPEAAKPGDKKDDKPVAAPAAPAAPGTPPAAPGTPPAAQQSGDPDEPPKDAVADYQLLRAVDLIKGISLYSSRAN